MVNFYDGTWWKELDDAAACDRDSMNTTTHQEGLFSWVCMYILCGGGGVVGMYIYALQLCCTLNERSSLLMLSFRKGNILVCGRNRTAFYSHSLNIPTRQCPHRLPHNPCADLPFRNVYILFWSDAGLARYAGQGLEISILIRSKLRFLSICHIHVKLNHSGKIKPYRQCWVYSTKPHCPRIKMASVWSPGSFTDLTLTLSSDDSSAVVQKWSPGQTVCRHTHSTASLTSRYF